jgi:hypothetical protein
MRIVPTPDNSPKPAGSRLLPPNKCYFKGKSNDLLHSELFAFIDFGPSANSFLNACGTKGEPSVEDIAVALIEDPRRFLQLVGGWDK